MPPVLRRRDFRFYFFARFVSDLGDNMMFLALSFGVLDLTRSVLSIGFVMAARSITFALLVPFGGVFGDRLRRKWILFWSDLIRLAAQAGTGFLLLMGHAKLWHLAALAAFYGAGQAFFAPTGNAFVAEIVPSPDRQQANATLSFSRSVNGIAGPVLAGLLVAGAGAEWAILLDAATFGVSAMFILGIQTEIAGRATNPKASIRGDLVAGWKEFSSRTWVWTVVVASAFYQIAVLPSIVVLGPAISNRFLGGAPTWALFSSAVGVGAVVGGLASAYVRVERPLRLAALLFLLDAPQLIFLGTHGPSAPLIVSGFIAGVSLAIFETLWITSLQQHIPPVALSRVMSYDWLGSLVTLPVGYALIGPVSREVGMSATLFAAAVGIALWAPVLLLIPSVRNLRRSGRGEDTRGEG